MIYCYRRRFWSGLMHLKKNGSFSTVARKFNYNYVYTFHVIYPEKTIWRSIVSQRNILNIFPASNPWNSIWRILENVCVRKTGKYIPQSALWIIRLSTELANENERLCLTLDCSRNNINGPGKFRIDGDKPDFQTGYFNVLNDQQL